MEERNGEGNEARGRLREGWGEGREKRSRVKGRRRREKKASGKFRGVREC